MPRARARSHQEPGNLTPTGLPTPPTRAVAKPALPNRRSGRSCPMFRRWRACDRAG